MSVDLLNILINLNMEDRAFTRAAAQFGKTEFISGREIDLAEIEDTGAGAMPDGVSITAFFERQASLRPDALSKALGMIGRAGITLEQAQLKQSVVQVNLVDCGDQLDAPISDFSVIAQLLEEFSQDFFANADGRVFAGQMDGDEPGSDIRFLDTRSQEFLSVMMDYNRSTLESLNSSMGQGDLPNFDT